jgi:hypothetical protein
MSLLREFLSYALYVVLVAVVAMAFGAIWHDFSVEFHKAVPHSAKRNRSSTFAPSP